MFCKLREILRDQAQSVPYASNVLERSEGVKRVNLPDPDEYVDKRESMLACETCELGLNEMHEAACALYIMHKYNQAVVDKCLGDENFGSERDEPMKARMKASVKEIIKNSDNAKAALGLTGGTSGKKAAKSHKRGGVAVAWKQFAAANISLPLGFQKQKGAAGGQLGGTVCFKCKEKGRTWQKTTQASRIVLWGPL
jgi:hypothetical protein